MKKNSPLIILSLVAAMAMAYGFTQKIKAEEQALVALQHLKAAEECRVMSEHQRLQAQLALRHSEQLLRNLEIEFNRNRSVKK